MTSSAVSRQTARSTLGQGIREGAIAIAYGAEHADTGNDDITHCERHSVVPPSALTHVPSVNTSTTAVMRVGQHA